MIDVRRSGFLRTIPLLITVCLFYYPAFAQYGGGTGAPNDPYLIYTAEQLNTIGLDQEGADKHFKLMADIDLSAYQGDSFNRIGFYEPSEFFPDWHPPFTGVFDGDYHIISNFTYVVDVNEPPSRGDYGDRDVGLFGVVSGEQAQIKNLVLVDPNIYPAATCSERVFGVGAIAGSLRDGSITNCYVEGGQVSADISVGGLVGSNEEGTISNCYTTCNVTWAQGRWLRPIEKPWGNTGYAFGGLAGSNGGQIYNCYATGRIQADSRVGGLVGGNSFDDHFNVVILDSFATGDVIGAESVGGLVGRNDDTISRCCAFGNVLGLDITGGLVGINRRLGNDQYVGIVTNSYAMSRIYGNNHAGGLAGVNMGTLITCYSTGEVLGTSNVGGLVGTNRYLSVDGTADNCFWDIETSRQWASKGGIFKTTEQMQNPKTFLEAGWDFVGETENGNEDIWKIVEGLDYPRLSWQKYSGGTGEPNDPYRIATADDLMLLGESPEDYDYYYNNFILIADIDLDPNLPGRKIFDKAVIAPDTNDIELGFQGTPFSGIFDGNGHIISNLTIEGRNYLGLFGQLGYRAKVTNLGLDAVYVNGTGDYVGGLVGTGGYSTSCCGGNILNCFSSGMVTGGEYVGGLMGMNRSGIVKYSYSTAEVNGDSYLGGLLGCNMSHWVVNCYSTGAVSGNEYVGGLVGANGSSYLTISLPEPILPLPEQILPIEPNLPLGPIFPIDPNFPLSPIDPNFIFNPIDPNFIVDPGFGPDFDPDPGFHMDITGSYGDIKNCYATGSVTGVKRFGGLVGENRSGSITASFWNIETSGITSISGDPNYVTGFDGSIGKTTAEMQTARTFLDADWDFVDETDNGTEDIWWIDEGQDYPRLWWELIPEN